MSKKDSSHSSRMLKILPPILTVALVLLCIYIGSRMSIQGLISYTPSNVLLAAAGILALFAVKSLSVIFPLSVLYIVSAFWFGKWVGLAVCYLGLVVSWHHSLSAGQTLRCRNGGAAALQISQAAPAAKCRRFQPADVFLSAAHRVGPARRPVQSLFGSLLGGLPPLPDWLSVGSFAHDDSSRPVCRPVRTKPVWQLLGGAHSTNHRSDCGAGGRFHHLLGHSK